MPKRLLATALLLSCLACAPAGQAAKEPPSGIPPQPRVLLVSWDGAKPSAIQRLLNEGKLPHLGAMMEGGAWTLRARVVGPTVTLPSHVTMVTGLPASEHGVTWNTCAPERGPVTATTLFDLCREAGLKSAMAYGKEKFIHLVKPGSPDEALFVEGGPDAAAAAGARMVREGSAALVMVHFAEADSAGHDFGWGDEVAGTPPSPRYLYALESVDRGLGVLLVAVGKYWPGPHMVILTADHGGHGDTHGSYGDEDVLIPWVAGGTLAAAAGELEVEVSSTDTAPTVLEALGLPIPATMAGRPVPCLRGETRKAA